jgi:hypothetical protein
VNYTTAPCAEHLAAAHRRILRRTRATSRGQRFRGFDC